MVRGFLSAYHRRLIAAYALAVAGCTLPSSDRPLASASPDSDDSAPAVLLEPPESSPFLSEGRTVNFIVFNEPLNNADKDKGLRLRGAQEIDFTQDCHPLDLDDRALYGRRLDDDGKSHLYLDIEPRANPLRSRVELRTESFFGRDDRHSLRFEFRTRLGDPIEDAKAMLTYRVQFQPDSPSQRNKVERDCEIQYRNFGILPHLQRHWEPITDGGIMETGQRLFDHYVLEKEVFPKVLENTLEGNEERPLAPAFDRE